MVPYFAKYIIMATETDSTLAVEDAASTFAALGSEQRLIRACKRWCVPDRRACPSAVLGDRSGVTGSTLTHHAGILTQAGLVHRVKW